MSDVPAARGGRAELLVLTALALLTRFWGLNYPRVVVWDEVHFERYAAAYFTGQYYVDVHPPLGKLLFAAAARLLGVSSATLAAAEPAPSLRLLPALAGALIIPVVFLLLRELGAGRRVATLGAALLLVDNALLVESRFILMDSMLVLFGMTAVLCYVLARGRHGSSHWWWLLACAITAGMAAGTKWTGLSALGLILLAWGSDALFRRPATAVFVKEGLILLFAPLAVYAGAFVVHFAILHRSGPGDFWMSQQFQATLEGNPLYRTGAAESFARSFFHLNRVMAGINVGWATDTNAGASPWYTWPIAKHAIGLWSPTAPGEEPVRWIILLANPVVWWGALFGVAVFAAAALDKRRRASLARHRSAVLLLAAGYTLNFLPFAFIKRPMYLYHYLFALIFSVMLAVLGVGALTGWTDGDADAGGAWRFPSRGSRALYVMVLGLAATTFAYLAPMSYGWPLSARAVVHRRMLLERHPGAEEDR